MGVFDTLRHGQPFYYAYEPSPLPKFEGPKGLLTYLKLAGGAGDSSSSKSSSSGGASGYNTVHGMRGETSSYDWAFATLANEEQKLVDKWTNKFKEYGGRNYSGFMKKYGQEMQSDFAQTRNLWNALEKYELPMNENIRMYQQYVSDVGEDRMDDAIVFGDNGALKEVGDGYAKYATHNDYMEMLFSRPGNLIKGEDGNIDLEASLESGQFITGFKRPTVIDSFNVIKDAFSSVVANMGKYKNERQIAGYDRGGLSTYGEEVANAYYNVIKKQLDKDHKYKNLSEKKKNDIASQAAHSYADNKNLITKEAVRTHKHSEENNFAQVQNAKLEFMNQVKSDVNLRAAYKQQYYNRINNIGRNFSSNEFSEAEAYMIYSNLLNLEDDNLKYLGITKDDISNIFRQYPLSDENGKPQKDKKGNQLYGLMVSLPDDGTLDNMFFDAYVMGDIDKKFSKVLDQTTSDISDIKSTHYFSDKDQRSGSGGSDEKNAANYMINLYSHNMPEEENKSNLQVIRVDTPNGTTYVEVDMKAIPDYKMQDPGHFKELNENINGKGIIATDIFNYVQFALNDNSSLSNMTYDARTIFNGLDAILVEYIPKSKYIIPPTKGVTKSGRTVYTPTTTMDFDKLKGEYFDYKPTIRAKIAIPAEQMGAFVERLTFLQPTNQSYRYGEDVALELRDATLKDLAENSTTSHVSYSDLINKKGEGLKDLADFFKTYGLDIKYKAEKEQLYDEIKDGQYKKDKNTFYDANKYFIISFDGDINEGMFTRLNLDKDIMANTKFFEAAK